jgi:HlyD family secretion protein
MMRIMFMVVVVSILAAGSYWLHANSRPMVRPSRPIASGPGAQSIRTAGIVEGAGRELSLRLEAAGRVEEILVSEGEFVKAGQLLVRLDDATQRHQIEVLNADIQFAEAQLERLKNGAHEHERLEAEAIHAARNVRLKHADAEWKRAKRLMETRAIGEQEVDRWHAEVNALTEEVRAAQARLLLLTAPPRDDELHAAQAKVESARAKLAMAKTELSRTRLHAPAAGQVLEIHRERGEMIDLDDPQPILVMADTRSKRVRAYVEEFDAPNVQLGMGANITADGLPGRVYRGEVVEVLPRMTFKQVWTDRPDERFDTKTREVVIEVRGEAAGSTGVDSSALAELFLVYGLQVEVELVPRPASPRAERHASTFRVR